MSGGSTPHDLLRDAGYSFTSNFLNFDGHRYHYIDQGAGDPILFVHGNPTWSFAWRKFVTALSDENRTIAVDHIGCGFSDKPQEYDYRLEQHISNLCRFVTELDLKRVTLVAHDWGGAIGMGAAGRLPERFSRFVLFNTAAFRSKQIPLRIAVCRIPVMGAIGVRGLNLFARAALTMAVAKPLPREVRAGYLLPYDNWSDRVAIHRFVQDIPLRPEHPSYQTLVGIENGLAQFAQSPVQFIWGLQDWCFTEDFLREFERRFPQAETLRLPDAGHYVFEDAPDKSIAAIRDFLARHPL